LERGFVLLGQQILTVNFGLVVLPRRTRLAPIPGAFAQPFLQPAAILLFLLCEPLSSRIDDETEDLAAERHFPRAWTDSLLTPTIFLRA
jgi:hypothetical protein